MGDETASSSSSSRSAITDGLCVVPKLSLRAEQVLERQEQWYKENTSKYYSIRSEVKSEIKSEIKSEEESAEEESEASGSRSTTLPSMDMLTASIRRMYPSVKKETKSEVLKEACNEGDDSVVGKLIKEGRSFREAFPGKRTIHIACERGHSSLVQTLLKQKANVDDRGDYGDEKTPLMIAAASGFVDIVRILLIHGADVNAINWTDGNTALVYACMGAHVETVKLLLESGANVNFYNRSGNTPLLETQIALNELNEMMAKK